MKNCAKNLLFTLLTGLGASAAWANPSVTITSVTQAIPWNGKVSIAYTVSGADGEGTWQLGFTGKIGAGTSFALQTFDEPPSLADGSHVAVWQADTDGAVFGKNPFVASAKLCRSDIVYDGEYMIVDVSEGKTATSYPISFVSDVADQEATFNTVEYKSDKILFKEVKGGTYQIGSPADEEGRNVVLYGYQTGGEDQQWVKITKDFFMSVYPITQTQLLNVVSYDNPSYTWQANTNNIAHGWGELKDVLFRPAERVTYATRAWGEGGFMTILNARAESPIYGKPQSFNFPTEAEWEYVCRAGTTTAYFFGADATDYLQYGYETSGNYVEPVGKKKSNPWGFHDMVGNCWQFCRDKTGPYLPGTEENPSVDPVKTENWGPQGGWLAVRGSMAAYGSKGAYGYARSASRHCIKDVTENGYVGLRPICTLDTSAYESLANSSAVTFDTDTSKESLLAATVDLSADEFTYTGSEQKPTVTVTMGDKILTEGTDYTAAYTASIQVGTHTVTLTGCGHYVGIVTRKYYISYPIVGEETVGTAAMDFRDGVLSVTAPGTLFRIARNNTADWSRGGVASETVKARVAFAPLATEDAEPAEGDFVLAVEADGEGTFKWIPPADGFYLARLQVVDGETVVSTLTRKLKVTKLGLAILIK